MDMAKRLTFGTKEWAEFVEFRIRSGLSVEEGFTLALLEMEVPFARLGFETFAEFLNSQIPDLDHLLKDPDLSRERSLIPIESSGDLKIGSRVIWFGKDSTAFKGTVNWLGRIERILCAGVFMDQKIGSPFPVMWRGKRLFYTSNGHSLVLRVNELILKSDYSQRQTSMLTKALTKLMRKVSICERPRERNNSDSLEVDSSKVQQFDVIYPYAVAAGPSGLKANDAIVWANNAGSHKGVVKWLGHLNCKSGLTVGIDFKSDIGNCSGEYEGHKLFDCKPNQGKFLCIECIRKSDIQYMPTQSSSSLISTHTFEFTNQDLGVEWQRNQLLPRKFQLGDVVLYQRDSNSYHTGTLEWLGTNAESELAGIRFDTPIRNQARFHTEALPFECPSERGDIVPIDKIVPYVRPRSEGEPPLLPVGLTPAQLSALRSRASQVWSPHNGVIAPCFSRESLQRLIGYTKGVEGQGNSFHMDAVLFAIFSCSETFDAFLLRTEESDSLLPQILKEVLRTEVVNRLRKICYCPASNVQSVAQVFSKGEQTSLPGKPDQILETFLESVNPDRTKNPFLEYKDGTFSYVHRIMATASNMSENIVTIQKLLEVDMKLKSLQFLQEPSPALVVVLPERNEELAPSKIFIPNFILELSGLMTDGDSNPHPLPPELSSPCALCGESSSTECPDCEDLLASTSDSSCSSSSNTFCDQCSQVFHQHWTRRGHRKVSSSGRGRPRRSLELQSIICTRDSQSIAFVKCGPGQTGEWIVHDSIPDTFSPQVQNVFSLTDCLLSLEADPSSIPRDWDSFIPEVKIILSFAHMCIYTAVESSRDSQGHGSTGN